MTAISALQDEHKQRHVAAGVFALPQPAVEAWWMRVGEVGAMVELRRYLLTSSAVRV